MDIAVTTLLFLVIIGCAIANAPKVNPNSTELIGVACIFIAGMMFSGIIFEVAKFVLIYL